MLFRAATAAAEMVRSGQFSSRELTELALARIDALNPSRNAVVELRPEAALQDAATADEVSARGGVMGPRCMACRRRSRRRSR
jgi:amidase